MAQDAWGPLDWCANGVGGEELTALPADGDDGFEEPEGFEEPDGFDRPGPEPRPERRSQPRSGWRSERRVEPQSPPEARGPVDPAERARAICLRLLTGSAKTRGQLAEALRKRDIPQEVADEVLSRYQEVGLIDDAAFAGAWVESRHRGRGLARRALATELRSRGVDNAVVAEAVARLDPEQEAATARALVERKLRSTSGLDRQVRIRRLAGMLARRGYSEGLALRVVRQALDEEGNPDEGLPDEGLGEGW
ncbi:recombination regulator RecX [Streptacidiphilus sp. PB12-B1b]|uniref:recombination regulator RecX n=1 Tax=Streptacidiphilus sp. PB12-B1b TaxID=2705012 RepID=UPI0015FD902A|nr:recombination regulator RecX [Streptacidiphilus sp. PB12-B1b]QMU78765.1 recombination regulator RecX [Streptacidiphilus sp. PB12-B1b]